jgi:subtilisin family serine protease
VAVAAGAALAGAAGALTATPNDPLFPQQWGMRMIGAPQAWAAGTGRGVTIAVVDTGVDLHHPDLAGRIVGGANFINSGQPPQDDYGHGTHVAGIAAADADNGVGVVGVAPGASIMPVKVLDSTGRGSTATIGQGIQWAVDHGARVINLSLGSDLQPLTGASTDITNAVEYAWQHGAVCVIAAGNSGLLGIFGSGYSNLHAVIVTALTPQGTLASYATDVGSAMWGMAAPGGAADGTQADDIVSTYWDSTKSPPDVYATLAGTSMATPHVAGAAAILLGLGLSPQQTVDRMLSSARNLGNPSVYGAGQLDVAAAVAGLGSSPPPTAPATTAAPAPATATSAVPSVRGPATTAPVAASITKAATTTTAPAPTTTATPPPPGVALSPAPPRSSPVPALSTTHHTDGLPALPGALALAALLGVLGATWRGAIRSRGR